ncbi:MAG: hypothetical protein AAF399_19540 [Bacteroidota bacterium]
MKNLITILLILIGLVQVGLSQNKPVAGDISLGFRVTGLNDVSLREWNQDAFGTPEVMGRYFISDQLAVRARIGANVGGNSAEFSDQYIDSVRFGEPLRIDSATVTRQSGATFSFSPGAEYHLNADASRLDPYVGAELLFGFKGATENEIDLDYQRVTADAIAVYREDLNTKVNRAGGISVGFNILGGFNYFFTEKIAIGAEYAIGYLYRREGGDVRVATTGSLIPGGDPTNVVPVAQTDVFQELSTESSFFTGSTVGINFSVFW